MAAYAGLVSVKQIIDQLEDHPHPPISIHQQQVTSLTQIIAFLQDFLEGYNPHPTYINQADPLETRIAEAAHAAEDVMESYIVDQILAPSQKKKITSCFEFFHCLQTAVSYIVDQILARSINRDVEFYQGLQKVIEEMDLIKMEVVKIKQNKGIQHQQLHMLDVAAHSFRSSTSTSTPQKVGMVGFDDVLYQMLEQITRGRPHLQIIPIVGMGGIGKTTLARNISLSPLVREHFDVCAWSTISQQYNAHDMLRQVLHQVGLGNLSEDEYLGEQLYEYLGEQLYKYLIGRRYLIVMDDMWSIDAWDRVRRFFPDNENGSRVVITTRLSNLASQCNSPNSLEMKFLDEASSWYLFSRTVFGEGICPLELEDIGRKIVNGCKGLPLSIAVIGGLLSKTGQTRENWELIEENLNSVVNLEDNESCLQILFMSYNNLLVYLKPCFLYMGVFREDAEVQLFSLITRWVAEGFLKPIQGRSLEEVAELYVEELVARNLLLVEKRNHFGKLESCKIHDLLRDLAMREAQKAKFLCVLGEQKVHDIPRAGIISQRRIASTLSEYPSTPLLQHVESASLVRSLTGEFFYSLSYYNFRLLRVTASDRLCYIEEKSSENDEDFLHGLVNLRYLFLSVYVGKRLLRRIPSSVNLFWNLQTVLLSCATNGYIFEIWKMPQLRHVIADRTLYLPDPPPLTLNDHMHMESDNEVVVLKNLQTLRVVSKLNLSEGVVKRIPNIKSLDLYYDQSGDYSLNNLSRLHNLESLSLYCSDECKLFHMVSFPYALKELTLEETELHWEVMQTKIGWLPNLQVLRLKQNSFIGSEWETFEGQFSSLRLLKIESCTDLENWKTDSYTHFPRLERLVLRYLQGLREIPSSIGDIPTLEIIRLQCCSVSANDSAQIILEEQEELGNEDLQVTIL